MARFETNQDKIIKSYLLEKNKKLYKKARAVVIKDNKLLLIKIQYNNGKIHYLLPGGGIDDNETVKQAIIRETLEEYNAVVSPIKYLDKQYYNIDLEYNNEKFTSHRVEYYYLCKFEKFIDNMEMGVGDEFKNPEKKYSKVELSLSDVFNTRPCDINNISERTYERIVNYLKSL